MSDVKSEQDPVKSADEAAEAAVSQSKPPVSKALAQETLDQPTNKVGSSIQDNKFVFLAIGAGVGAVLAFIAPIVLQAGQSESFETCLAREAVETASDIGEKGLPRIIVLPLINDQDLDTTQTLQSALNGLQAGYETPLLHVQSLPCSPAKNSTSILDGAEQARNAAERVALETRANAIVWGEVLGDDGTLKMFATSFAGMDIAALVSDDVSGAASTIDEFALVIAARVLLADTNIRAETNVTGAAQTSRLDEGALQHILELLNDKAVQANKEPVWSQRQLGTLHHVRAKVWSELSAQRGDVEDLQKAIEDFVAASEYFGRFDYPQDWALVQNELGVALLRFGQANSSIAEIDMAISSFEAALSQSNRKRAPLKWGAVKTNLANALSILGPREPNDEKLIQAARVYREALEEHTLERMPLEWAALHHNMGTALQSLGQKKQDVQALSEAVSAYELALEIRTPEISRSGFIASQINLGASLSLLADLGAGAVALDNAINAYRAALSEMNDETQQIQRAIVQHSKALSLLARAQTLPGVELLNEAQEALLESLNVFTRDRLPSRWAVAQNNLGNVLQELGLRGGGVDQLDQATKAYENALEVLSTTSPAYAESVVQNLARTQQLRQKARQNPQ